MYLASMECPKLLEVQSASYVIFLSPASVKTNVFFIKHAQLIQAIITFAKMEVPTREY